MSFFPLSAPAHRRLRRGHLLFLGSPLLTPQPCCITLVLPASPCPSSLLRVLLPGSAPQTAEQLHPSLSFPGLERFPVHTELAPLTPSAPPLRKPVCRLQLPVLLEASAQSLAFQLTPAHTALPCSSGLCPDAEDGPVGPAGDGEAGANWGSSTERQQLAGGERLLTPGGGQRSAATERWEARAQQGGARGKGHVCSGQFTLVYSGNQHNLVKQLFSNYNSLKEDAKEKKDCSNTTSSTKPFLTKPHHLPTMPTSHPAHHRPLVSPHVPPLPKGRACISFTLFTRFRRRLAPGKSCERICGMNK